MAIYSVDETFDGDLPKNATVAVDVKRELAWRLGDNGKWSGPLDYSLERLKQRQIDFCKRLNLKITWGE